MFDSHSYHHTTRVTQQPNDAADAARLYGELKKEGEKDIMKVARTAPNEFQAVIHQQQEAMTGQMHLKAIYSLNGKEVKDHVTYDAYMETAEDGIRKLHEQMSKTIAAYVLEAALRDMPMRGF